MIATVTAPTATVSSGVSLENLSISIVSWNCAEELAACLGSLVAEAPECPVTVVDNASSDGSVQLLRSRFPRVSVVANTSNIGFGPAHNLALRTITTEFALILNPDTLVTRAALEACVRVAVTNPTCGLVGCAVVDEGGRLKAGNFRRLPTLGTVVGEHLLPANARREPSRPATQQPSDVEALPGAFMILRMVAGREVGFFDDRLFLYAEDLDLCKRIREAGWRVLYVPSATVVHHGARSSAVVPTRSLFHYYVSEDYYFRKHHRLVDVIARRAAVCVGCSLRLALAPLVSLPIERRSVLRAVLRASLAALASGTFFQNNEILPSDFPDARPSSRS